MTAVAVHSAHGLQLSWPRVSAWSGSLSLHLVILGLLLAPPAAIEFVRRVDPVDPRVRIIEVEPITEIPAEPVPPTHTQRKPVRHTTAPVQVATQQTEMSRYVPPVEAAPPSIEPAAAAPIDSEPSAIEYGTKTLVAYPPESLRNHEQGTVMLRVLVGTDGIPQTVEIAKSSGWSRLDRAARDAVTHWSFHPAIRNGMAHSAWALVPVTFNLSTL
jgi:protein TonB